MRLNEIREMSVEEAEVKLSELKSELAKERALVASGTRSENPAKIKKLRKTIARIFTIINEKKQRGEKNKINRRK